MSQYGGKELEFFKTLEYYSQGGIEVKDVQKAKMPPELSGMQCAYWFNVVKYILRCGWKGTLIQDLEKALEYLEWLVEDVKKNGTS